MPEIYKAFVYILAASLPAMYVAHLALKPMVGAAELRVWWTAWLCATAALLLSGNMLIYSALIAAISIYAHKTSTAPFNLFLVLLLSAPAVSENIAIPGLITSLIELSPPRIFALALLLPTAIRLWRAPSAKPLSTIDLLFGAFAGLIMVLSLRHGSPTYTLRVMALVMIDILLPYYVFSRALTSLEDIKKSLSAFIFGALPFAAVGALEMARTWRLYNSLSSTGALCSSSPICSAMGCCGPLQRPSSQLPSVLSAWLQSAVSSQTEKLSQVPLSSLAPWGSPGLD